MNEFYLEAPNKPSNSQIRNIITKSIFLYGGISGCPNWQFRAKQKLSCITDLFIINPRRETYDINNSGIALDQIEWEYTYSKLAKQRMFWFCKETVQPITLYELGKELGQVICAIDNGYATAPIFVGVDSRYPRALDVREQMKYITPEIPIYSNLEGILDSIIHYNLINAALLKQRSQLTSLENSV
jgi:hypothetical protein